MKPALQRVNDTVNFIQNSTVVPPLYTQQVTALVNQYLAAIPGGQGGQTFTNVSGSMSLGRRPLGQSSDSRHMARAVYLLWEVIQDHDPTAQIPYIGAQAVPLADARILFEFAMYKTLMVAGPANQAAAAAQHVLENVVRNSPRTFLRHNRLLINGSTRSRTGPGDQNLVTFDFRFEASYDRFSVSPTAGLAGSYQFQAASIAATHWTAVPGRGNNPAAGSFAQIHATELGGATIAVTTQFTGCSLCFNTSGGNTYAAHIAPGGPTTLPQIGGGQLLAQQLCGTVPNVAGAAFANAPGAVSVYGRQHSNLPAHPGGYGGANLQYFTMIGFDNGGWKLYAQEVHIGGFRGLGLIQNVRRIYS